MPKLQGAFIGFGNIAQLGHWPSYAASQDAEIIAVMDPSPARRVAAKALRPDMQVFESLEDMYRTQKLDFVDICTPPASHAVLAIQALEHGAHVLCEKPLSLKAEEFRDIAAAMARTRKTVFTVHNWKYAPIFQKALSILKEGKIGPVWHVDIFTLRNSHCKGVSKGAAGGKGASDDWRKDPSIAGGGILVDHGWHSFYLLMNLVGAEPQTVLSKMLRSPSDPASLEEAAQTLVQFPEADGYVHLTWRSKLRRNSVVIQGQSGTLLLDDDRILLTTHDGQKEEITFPAALSAGSHHADWFQALLPDFVKEVRDPAARGANFREAGWCLALMASAYQSNLHGFKEVTVQFPTADQSQTALA